MTGINSAGWVAVCFCCGEKMMACQYYSQIAYQAWNVRGNKNKGFCTSNQCTLDHVNAGVSKWFWVEGYKAKVGGRDCGGRRAFMLGGSGGMPPWENFSKIGFKWLIFRHSDNFKRDFYGLNIHWKRLPQTPHPNILFSTGDAHPWISL